MHFIRFTSCSIAFFYLYFPCDWPRMDNLMPYTNWTKIMRLIMFRFLMKKFKVWYRYTFPRVLCSHAFSSSSSSLTLLSLHPLALQQADVEPLLCVLVSDVQPGSQRLQRVPRRLHVTRRAHRSLVLHHLRGQPEERSEVKGRGQQGRSLAMTILVT